MIPTPGQMHHDDPESLTLRDLNLTKRPYTVLTRNKVTVSELLTMTREDLLAYRGLGEGSVNAIAVSLKRHGLSLRTSPPTPRQERHQRARERGLQLRDRWLAGETMAQIAVSEGVSQNRVSQLIMWADPDAAAKRRAATQTKAEQQGLRLRDRWLAGETQEQLAVSEGLSPQQVSRLIMQADPDAAAKRKAATQAETEQRGLQLRDRWLAGETQEQIAFSEGVSQNQVSRLIMQADPDAAARHRAATEAEAVERGLQLRDRWLAGETQEQIAFSEGVSQNQVHKLIMQADPNAAAKRKAATQAKAEQQGLRLRDRWLAGETMAQIAVSEGLSPNRVSRLIMQADPDAAARHRAATEAEAVERGLGLRDRWLAGESQKQIATSIELSPNRAPQPSPDSSSDATIKHGAIAKTRTEQRGLQLRDRWLAGETMAQIAFSEGISPEKARQLIMWADPYASARLMNLRRNAARAEAIERGLPLRDRWLNGETLEQLAVSEGLSPKQVHQLIMRADHRAGTKYMNMRRAAVRAEATERGLQLRDRWLAGESLEQIAVSEGISPKQVHQLIMQADPNAAVKHSVAAKAEATERGLPLRDRWLTGESLEQIAVSEGVSPERARQLILQADHDAPTKRRILQAAARGRITAEEVKQLFDRLNPGAEREEKLPDAT